MDYIPFGYEMFVELGNYSVIVIAYLPVTKLEGLENMFGLRAHGVDQGTNQDLPRFLAELSS